MSMCEYVCVVRACVCSYVRACMRACVRACLCLCVGVGVCACVSVGCTSVRVYISICVCSIGYQQ